MSTSYRFLQGAGAVIVILLPALAGCRSQLPPSAAATVMRPPEVSQPEATDRAATPTPPVAPFAARSIRAAQWL